MAFHRHADTLQQFCRQVAASADDGGIVFHHMIFCLAAEYNCNGSAGTEMSAHKNFTDKEV
jgi:hypothetical protein